MFRILYICIALAAIPGNAMTCDSHLVMAARRIRAEIPPLSDHVKAKARAVILGAKRVQDLTAQHGADHPTTLNAARHHLRQVAVFLHETFHMNPGVDYVADEFTLTFPLRSSPVKHPLNVLHNLTEAGVTVTGSYAYGRMPPRTVYDARSPGYAVGYHMPEDLSRSCVTPHDLVYPLERSFTMVQDTFNVESEDSRQRDLERLRDATGIHALHERDHQVVWNYTVDLGINHPWSIGVEFDPENVGDANRYYLGETVYETEGYVSASEVYTYFQQKTRELRRMVTDVDRYLDGHSTVLSTDEGLLRSLVGQNHHFANTLSNMSQDLGARLTHFFFYRFEAALKQLSKEAAWNSMTIVVEPLPRKMAPLTRMLGIRFPITIKNASMRLPEHGETMIIPLFFEDAVMDDIEAKLADGNLAVRALVKPTLEATLLKGAALSGEARQLYQDAPEIWENAKFTAVSRAGGYELRTPSGENVGHWNPSRQRFDSLDHRALVHHLETTISPLRNLAWDWTKNLVREAATRYQRIGRQRASRLGPRPLYEIMREIDLRFETERRIPSAPGDE
jgi:hypothetical protein